MINRILHSSSELLNLWNSIGITDKYSAKPHILFFPNSFNKFKNKKDPLFIPSFYKANQLILPDFTNHFIYTEPKK